MSPRNCVVYSLIFFLLQQMRSLGIYSRLDEVFDAPTAVKHVLIEQSGLDRSVRIYFSVIAYIHKPFFWLNTAR